MWNVVVCYISSYPLHVITIISILHLFQFFPEDTNIRSIHLYFILNHIQQVLSKGWLFSQVKATTFWWKLWCAVVFTAWRSDGRLYDILQLHTSPFVYKKSRQHMSLRTRYSKPMMPIFRAPSTFGTKLINFLQENFELLYLAELYRFKYNTSPTFRQEYASIPSTDTHDWLITKQHRPCVDRQLIALILEVLDTRRSLELTIIQEGIHSA